MAGSARSDGKRTTARTRGRPNSDTAAQIDREILEAARELFFSAGYERTSMAMIVKAARVSKTTLYARYSDKADLFRATVRQTLDQMKNSELSAKADLTKDLTAGLKVFGNGALTICLSPFWLNYERLVYAEGPNFPELSDAVADRIDIGIQKVSSFIRTCAERDGVSCRNADAIATTYFMALRGYFTASILRSHAPSDAQNEAFVSTLVETLVSARTNW